MPTYQYHCQKCDRDFDKIQPMADAALTTCPKDLCQAKSWGKGKVNRVISGGAGLIFKGTGFYITDYRSDKYKEAAKKDVPASAGSSKSEGGKSSSKDGGNSAGGSTSSSTPSTSTSTSTSTSGTSGSSSKGTSTSSTSSTSKGGKSKD